MMSISKLLVSLLLLLSAMSATTMAAKSSSAVRGVGDRRSNKQSLMTRKLSGKGGASKESGDTVDTGCTGCCGCSEANGKKSSRRVYFESFLAFGEEEIIYESGPIQVRATCHESHMVYDREVFSANVALEMKIEWNSTLFIFGEIADYNLINGSPVVDHVLPADTVIDGELWRVFSTGSLADNGAVWFSSGDYFGWHGEQLIGLADADSNKLALVGDGKPLNCILAGHYEYVSSE